MVAFNMYTNTNSLEKQPIKVLPKNVHLLISLNKLITICIYQYPFMYNNILTMYRLNTNNHNYTVYR